MATTRHTIATTLTAIAFASVLLTGCATGDSGSGSGSGSGGSGGSGGDAGASSQTTEEACTVLKDGVKDTLTELQDGIQQIQTDPAAAAKAVAGLASAFKTTATDVTNDDVRAVADNATSALNNFSDQINTLAADPESADQGPLQDSATDVQSAMTKLGATCP